jgi:hypothetical protein
MEQHTLLSSNIYLYICITLYSYSQTPIGVQVGSMKDCQIFDFAEWVP